MFGTKKSVCVVKYLILNYLTIYMKEAQRKNIKGYIFLLEKIYGKKPPRNESMADTC